MRQYPNWCRFFAVRRGGPTNRKLLRLFRNVNAGLRPVSGGGGGPSCTDSTVGSDCCLYRLFLPGNRFFFAGRLPFPGGHSDFISRNGFFGASPFSGRFKRMSQSGPLAPASARCIDAGRGRCGVSRRILWK